MPWDGGVLRLGAPPKRPRQGHGRPCEPDTVERVRASWEGSRLSVEAIAADAQVHSVTIWKWASAAGWIRPIYAPGPAWSKSREAWEAWRGRSAAGRAEAAALRILDELEADEGVDLPGLAGALSLIDAARARRRTGTGPGRTR